MSRNPVFSHEELVCKMAADPDGLDLDLAKAVYDEMVAVVEKEANRRHRLAKMVGSVILLTICHTILMMLVLRIWYWIK